RWKSEIQKAVNAMEKELKHQFDILIEEKRKENIAVMSEKPRAKIADIDANLAKMQRSINADIDNVKEYEKLYKELRKESKKKKIIKARLISTKNRIDTKNQKIVSTRRMIEQLHTNKNAIEDNLKEFEQTENERF